MSGMLAVFLVICQKIGRNNMCTCEDCQFFKEDFDYDDFGNIFDYCKCVLRNELIDTGRRKACKDFNSKEDE
jgi:hypothetical protein